MKVLTIGSDRKLFVPDSSVRKRVIASRHLFDELHIVVFAKKSLDLKPQQLADNVWLYPTNSINRWWYVFGAVRIGKKIIKDWKVSESVITTQDPFEAGVVGVKLKKKTGLPLQFQVHTDFLSPHFGQGFLNRMRVRIADSIMAQADSVRVVSKRIKDAIVARYKRDESTVSVLPVFVDGAAIVNRDAQTNYRDRYTGMNFIILMMSRLTHEKNVTHAFEILKEIVGTNKKVGLVVVGEGPEKRILEGMARKLEIEDNVFFEEWSNDIAAYYSSADLFLLTSFFEGYGMTIVEAGLHRVPVVASDVGIAQDFVDGEEIAVCPVGDTDCFVRKIERLIQDNGLRLQYISELERSVKERYVLARDMYNTQLFETLTRCIEARNTL